MYSGCPSRAMATYHIKWWFGLRVGLKGMLVEPWRHGGGGTAVHSGGGRDGRVCNGEKPVRVRESVHAWVADRGYGRLGWVGGG